MLALIQIINHMLVQLEYTETEVTAIFESVEAHEVGFQDMLDTLNLELSPTMLQLATAKLNKWPSALAILKMRNEV